MAQLLIDEQQLARGIERLGLVLDEPDRVIRQLLQFSELVFKWNKTHNLTAVVDAKEFVTKHLLDSLSLLPSLAEIFAASNSSGKRSAQPRNLLDIGSGAGFPGIPLAISDPGLELCSVDASHKRIVFQREVVRQLALSNVEPVHARVEQLTQAQGRFAVISGRAFASLQSIVQSSQQLLAPSGRWLLMKGQYPDRELEELQQGPFGKTVQLDSVQKIEVPGLDAERHLVCLASIEPAI